MPNRIVICLALLFLHVSVLSQDQSPDSSSIYGKLYYSPDKLFSFIQSKSSSFERQLTSSATLYLKKMMKREKKIRRRLMKTDSVLARQLFGDVDERYTKLLNRIEEVNPVNPLSDVYSGRLDSIKTTLTFLNSNGFGSSIEYQNDLKKLLEQCSSLQNKLNNVGQIKRIVQERGEYLKSRLASSIVTKEVQRIQEQIYYYRAQVDEYRRLFEQPHKIETHVLQALNKIPAFQQFFAKYSQLGNIFQLPNAGDPVTGIVPGSLQTRTVLEQDMAGRLGGSFDPTQSIQQEVGAVESQFNQFKNRIQKFGSFDNTAEVPDFKPNTQKTKSLLKRVEVGTNLQSTRSTYLFPSTTDIGFSIGYKVNDKSIVGIGASYKLGWGRDIRHVKVTSEGVGLRSFIDIKLKGSFFVTGGFEYNYQQPFGALPSLDDWRESGLLGITKTISTKTKYLKKTKLQLLWDALSYRQVPRAEPIKFRIGYSL